MSSRASRGMGMGMEKTGLGVDLLEELLAGHRRREHAERALGGACGNQNFRAVLEFSISHPPLAFAGLKVRSDLELLRPIFLVGRW